MRNRYKAVGLWRVTERYGDLTIECTDLLDKQTNHTYTDGAYRVCRNGKPFKVGKGGTVPHYGESAWAAAERDFHDAIFAARFD